LFLAKPGESEQDLRKRPEVVSLPRCNLELLDAQISAAPAHSAISAASAAVLKFFFNTDEFSYAVTSEVLPGIERSFTSFTAAADEAGLSRIYAGVHFRTDHTAGQQLGLDVAAYVTKNFLVPVSESQNK
jgi:hypothetical protein